MAAIASPEAAECYGLKVLLSNVQDLKENYTRFIVLKVAEKSSVEQILCTAEDQQDLVKSQPDAGQKSGYESLSELESKNEDSSHSVFKTSIILYLEKDRPGALYGILGAFAKHKINLTKIESRPSKKELGDYYFYIDFKGHTSEAIITDALTEVESKTDTLRILGSYPAFKK